MKYFLLGVHAGFFQSAERANAGLVETSRVVWAAGEGECVKWRAENRFGIRSRGPQTA